MWHTVVVARHHCSRGVCIMFRQYIPACLRLCDLTSHNTVISLAMKTSKSIEYLLVSWIAVYSYRKTIYTNFTTCIFYVPQRMWCYCVLTKSAPGLFIWLWEIYVHSTEVWVCVSMQTVCGSFTSLLKLRMGAKTDGTASDTSSQASEADCALPSEEVCKNAVSGVYYSQTNLWQNSFNLMFSN